jgi:hypothetical protein
MLPRSKPTVWAPAHLGTYLWFGLAVVAAIDAFNLSLDFSDLERNEKKKNFF